MAYTTKWGDLVTLGTKYAKGLPLANVTPQICDFVSQDIYAEYPWKQTIQNTASNTIPLLDTVQDYDCNAPNIDKPLKGWLERTDVTPHENRELDLRDDLAVDAYPRSWVSIRAFSLQSATGRFRLESAVQVPQGTRLELHVDYKMNPVKVTSLNDPLWFDDKYSAVAMEGMLYWIYKLSDDTRAGTAATDASGRATYSGQLATYKQALYRMRMAEDFGPLDNVFPAEPMGVGRDQNALNIFGW